MVVQTACTAVLYVHPTTYQTQECQHNHSTAQRSTVHQVLFSAAVTCYIHLCTHCIEGNLAQQRKKQLLSQLCCWVIVPSATCHRSIHCTALLAAVSAGTVQHPNGLVTVAKLANTVILSNTC